MNMTKNLLAAVALLVATMLAGCTAQTAVIGVQPVSPTVLITGSSRGIGLELARQYAEKGWGVVATCRNPDTADALQALAQSYPNLVVERLDVTDYAEMDALAERYAGVPIDVLINNAGILGGNDRQKFGSFDYAAFDEVMAVNVKGAIRMAETFVDNVAASEQKKIMNISSLVGSIGMTFGGQNFYRASKAALNMSMRTIAKELRRSKEPGRKDILVGLIHPGVVATDFAKNVPIPMIEPAESAAAVIKVIDSYQDRRQSGDFMSYTGKELPW
jgi:NAD(P)-dependent dehydrogenase (short-subunit alcohol dehydrogenase family)